MPPFDDDAVARRVLAERAYGGIYSSQYADAAKSAHSNEMAKRLGIDPQVVESDYPNMMAEDRLRRATQAANASPHYAGMMANPRFAAAAIDDKSIHPLADAVAAHQDRQANRPTKGGFLAGFQAVDSYLGSAFNSGLYSAAAVAGNVASSMERGFGQVKDVGRLLSDPFGNDKKLQMQTLVAPTKSTPLTRFAENMQRASQKAAVSNKYYDDLTYGASDPSKSAFLSPIRMVHDVLQSLPTSSAFVAIGVLTKGANLSAIAAAEARGLAPEIAKQLGIRAAVKMATMTGAVGEGIVGGAQQEVQTRVQVLDDPKLAETSPLYKMLIKSGINADDARQYIATQAGSDAGLAAGAVDAITNIASGPILGRIIGEGGPVLQRALKGFLTEGTQEAVQGAGEQVGQNAALKEYVDPHQSLVDGVVENMLASFAVGGLSGGGMTAALGHASEAEHATAAASDVDKVMSMAAQSTTRTANPTDFQTVLAQALEGRPGENLYIPADKVTELFQDTSITDDAFWGQYANQLEQAHAIGGDVVIPLSEAATHLAGSPQWQQLREHVRATPGGMSLIEAKNPQTTEELEAAANGLAEHIDRVAPQLEAGRAVKDFVGAILPAGEQADKATQLLGANLAVQTANENQKRAARGEAPITPTEMFKRWKLTGETTTQASQAKVEPAKAPTAPKRVKKAAKAAKPLSIWGFIKQQGGIKNSEGHGLTSNKKGRGMGLHRFPGVINNKTGISIDHLGELMLEAGYFPEHAKSTITDGVSSLTEADVLELLDKASRGDTVLPAHEMADALMAAQTNATDGQEEHERAAIEAWLNENGYTSFSDAEKESMLFYRADGRSIEDAVGDVMADIETEYLDKANAKSAGANYGPAADQAYEGHSDPGASQSDNGPQAVQGDASPSGSAAGQSSEVPFFQDQRDAFGNRPSDTKDWLQRLADERLKPSKEQKPVGSDGGLFDTPDTQTTLFQTVITGEEIAPLDAPVKQLRSAARSWYNANLKGQAVESKALGGREVKFASSRKAFSASADPLKLRAFAVLKDIIASGSLVDSISDTSGAAQSKTKAWHFIEGVADIGGEQVTVRVSVREDNNGNLYYNHVLQDGDPAPSSRRSYLQSRRQSGGGATTVDDVAKTADEINLSVTALNSGKRGAISISHDPAGNMTSAVIRAFETANFSTFVHEMGHFWLEDLRMRALASDATEQERADWQTVQDWFFDNGHDASQSIPTDAHELWARGTERYIYEGKAPSRGLGALFARMRDWMQELYHSVSAFNSPISPEIRQVMDRMFASDNEIQQQQDALALASAHVEGLMTDAELAEYRKLSDDARTDARDELYASVLSTLKREKQAERSARTKEVKADVTEQVDAEPIFTALNILRTGIPDGEQRQRARLSKQWLIDTYGKDILDTMPKGVTPIIADTDTMDAEQIAEMAGFVSADQMIKALQAHERQRQGMKNSGDKRSPRQASIEEGTTQRIRDEMGDPFANLEEEAQAALSNDRQAEAMSMELRALARKTANRPTPWKMATTWAASHIAQTRVRDSISGSALQMYARNAGKAGRSGEDALVKGNFDEAFQYKQQQMLNLALLSEGKKIKDRVEKAVRKMHDIAGKKTIKSVDQDYLDQAHQLLEGVDLKERPLTRVDKRQQFEAWYADQVAQGIEPIVPPEYRHILGTTNFKNITNDELLQLGDVVSQIMKLGRLKQRLIDGKDERDFHEAAAEMRAVAEDQLQRKRSGANDPARVKLLGVIPSERIKSGLRSFDAALIKLETIIDWMDDGDPNGPWNRMILRPLSNSQGQEADMLRDYAKEVNEHIKAVPREQARRWARWVDTPELINNIPGHPERGTPMQFGMDQVVMMAMNWGNEGSRQRLVDGFGWDEDVVKGVLDRLMTKEDWDFTQNIWNTVNTLWPAMAEMERRVNGVAPPKVEAVSIDTPHGTYEGGYFPAIYDPTYSTTAQLQEQDKLSPNGGFFKATTRAGSTHERVAAVKGRPLLLNLGVITRHMSEVIHDISHREAIQQVTRLLADKGIRTAVDNALGPEYLKTMERVVDNIARPGVANSKSHPALVNIARRLNKGVSVVGMGFRVSTILQQPLGLANMIGEVGERAVMEGMAVSIAHPVRTYNEVTTRSAEMRHRFSNMDATIHEMWESQKAGKLAVMGPAGIEKAAFQGIAYADAMITTGGWIGAYNKALREGMADDDAVHYADKAIRRSQGAGGAKDQSPVQFDHAFVRAFVPFFSYLNANYNQRRDVGHKLRRAEGAGDYARVAKQYWWVAIVPAMMQALLFGQGPDDDTPEGWAEYLGIQQMLGGLATIPGIGPLANSLGNGYGYRATPWQQFGENIGKTTHDVKASLDGNDDTEVSKSWIKNSMYVAGVATSKPLGQLGATAQGVHDYATGEADPQTSGDWYNLLTKGSIPQKH